MPAPAQVSDGMGSLLYTDGTCRFRVWAPFASKVQVSGDFTGWTAGAAIDLASEPGGNWSADVPGVKAGQLYRYQITNNGQGIGNDNSQVWDRADARSLQVQSSNGMATSYVIDQFSVNPPINRQAFSTPGFDSLMLYQIHVGSFIGLNDGVNVNNRTATFVDLIDRLGYIRGLGFNALALMPIGERLGDTSPGYGISDMFAPEDAYGTDPGKAVAELVQLIDAAHAVGLAVIFDVVFSHAAISDNRYARYDGNCYGPNGGGEYHENAHDTRFGWGFAFWRNEVQDFFLDNLRTFFRDYRIDGVRFDAAQFIPPDAMRKLVWQTRAEFPDKYLIAEYNPGDQESASGPLDAFGDLGFHATWDLAAPSQMSDALSGNGAVQNLLSLIGNFDNPNPWHSVRYPTGAHDQIYSAHGGLDGKAFFTRQFGGRGNGWARAKTRMAWALAATLPGTPMMFMGTEGMLDWFWDPDSDAGEHRIDWAQINDQTGRQMQQLVRDANNLRWNHPAFRAPAGNVTHVDYQSQVVAFKRYTYSNDLVLVVVNAGDGQWAFHDYGVDMGGEGGSWHEIFNSQSPDYGAVNTTGNPNQSINVENGCLWINLPCWSVIVLQKW